MSDNWYLYVNKETLRVSKVSPALEEEDGLHVIMIERELGLSFINAPHTINDYVVYYDGTVAHFIKKEKSKEVVVPFYYSPLIIVEGVENPDILLTYDHVKDSLTISLRDELKAYAMTMYSNVGKQKQRIEFYVSAKNDPNQLYGILHLDMMDLIAKGSVEFSSFEFDIERVSIFTRKIFDSYGLKIMRS